MRITSSTVDAHEFTVVRKKGYDPAEVDAVKHRLVETLQEYEDTVARLQRELQEAEQSEEAIKRTFVAAQRTKDEMLEEARREAHSIKAKAKQEADAMVSATRAEVEILMTKGREEAQTVFDDATATLARANAEADQTRAEANEILDAAKAKADSIRSQADEVLTSAMSEAEQIREQADVYLRTHQQEGDTLLARAAEEADKTTSTARAVAERILSDAKSEAAEKLATSRREAEALIGSAVAEAKSQRARVKMELEELRASRQAEAEELLTAASNEAGELRSKAAAEAEVTTSQARAEAEDLVNRAKTDAADRISSSQAQAEKILDHARGRADEIVKDARAEKAALDRRVAQLRTAVSEIERELHKLAEAALERASFVSGVIDLTQQDAAAAADVSATAQGATIEARRATAYAPRPSSAPHPIPSVPQDDVDRGPGQSGGGTGRAAAGPQNHAGGVATATVETRTKVGDRTGSGDRTGDDVPPAHGEREQARADAPEAETSTVAEVARAEASTAVEVPETEATETAAPEAEAAAVAEVTEAIAGADDAPEARTGTAEAVAPVAEAAEATSEEMPMRDTTAVIDTPTDLEPPTVPTAASVLASPPGSARVEGDPYRDPEDAEESRPKSRFATPEEATRRMIERRRHAFASPDGSGKPPAERQVIEPKDDRPSPSPIRDEEERPATIYQRRGGGIRRRLQGRMNSPSDQESGSGDSDRDAGTE